jgi:hypothetical protein
MAVWSDSTENSNHPRYESGAVKNSRQAITCREFLTAPDRFLILIEPLKNQYMEKPQMQIKSNRQTNLPHLLR